MTIPGGDLPFGLEIEREQDQDIAWLVNGPERVRVSEVSIDGDRVSMQMPGYPHRLEATLSDGRLSGEVLFMRPGGETLRVRLIAERDKPWRFFPDSPGQASDFSGRWALDFTNPETGRQRSAIAVLSQQDGEVNGTVLRNSGDERYLAGQVRGNTLMLSRFDGGSAILYLARIDDAGGIEGEYRGASGAFDRFTGRRDATAELEEEGLMSIREDGEKLAFSFPDLDGNPVSLADERFRDKVVIVTIGGTWCPNCHDEAVFLREFLAGRRERGLEVVQLMFEYTDDPAEARALARGFAKEYRIDYPVLVAGSYGDVSKALPIIEKFYAYPTMLVLDRQGNVVHTHTGFSGPATGEAYTRFAAEFGVLMDGLLEEK